MYIFPNICSSFCFLSCMHFSSAPPPPSTFRIQCSSFHFLFLRAIRACSTCEKCVGSEKLYPSLLHPTRYIQGGELSLKTLGGWRRRRCLLQPSPSFLPPGQLDISPLTKRGDRGEGKFHGIRINNLIKIPLLSLVFYLKKTRTYYSGRKEIKNPGKLYDSVLPHLCPGWSYKKLQHHFPSPIFFPSFLPAA